jgi:4-hydroxy-tetrahydrodipicolinate reductase
MAMRAFTSRLGWHIKSASTGTEILLADKDIKSHGLGRYIRPGEIIGSKDFARYEIEGGPVIEVSFAAKIFSDNERAVNHWKIWGEPNLNVETLDFPGFEVTCASVINRIPDVMLAPPGFLSVCDIPPARFRASLTTEP